MRQKVQMEAAGHLQRVWGRHPDGYGIGPGRVELLGNHTDYNGGYIIGASLDRVCAIAGSLREDRTIRAYSATMDDTCVFRLDDLAKDPEHPWADYIKGVLVELAASGISVSGIDLAVSADVPLGSGLSSSAAIEVATALLVQDLSPFSMERIELAQLCRRAENNFVGVGCGILDQFCSLFGAPDTLLFLDCLTLQHEEIPVDSSAVSVVVMNSMAKRELVQGEYDVRRAQCFSAAEKLGRSMKREIQYLREVSSRELQEHGKVLSPVEEKRARHVILENERVLRGRELAGKGDMEGFAALMTQSHESSRDLFENSSPRLDTLIEVARSVPGFLGGKLCGGGFGGAAVALVRRAEVETFCEKVADAFEEQHGQRPDMLVSRIG